MSRFILKTADSAEEILAVQQLRYKVFSLEMGADLGVGAKEGMDKDEFDEFCDHLLIKEAQTQRIIGTYRMLLGRKAKETAGFYSQKEFDLTDIFQLQEEVLEVGRSCICPEYRRKVVLNLLWQGIARYAMSHGVRYIFGCASIFTTNICEISRYYLALRQLGYFNNMSVGPVEGRPRLSIEKDIEIGDPEKIISRLPILFKGYLTLGLKVCGEPIVDPHFGTTDFLILLDIRQMNPVYKKRLFGKYLSEGKGEFLPCGY